MDGGRKKQSEENIIKNIRNLFKLKKENNTIKDRIIRDIRTLFEQQQEEKDCYKRIRVGKGFISITTNFKYKISSDRNKNLSVKDT